MARQRKGEREQDLHLAVAKYFATVLDPTEVFATTFPAGGGGKARGGRLKSMGLVAGVPDWVLVYRGRVYFIELKTLTGRLSSAQKATIERLRAVDAEVFIARELDDIQHILDIWEIPHIGRISGHLVHDPWQK